MVLSAHSLSSCCYKKECGLDSTPVEGCCSIEDSAAGMLLLLVVQAFGTSAATSD